MKNASTPSVKIILAGLTTLTLVACGSVPLPVETIPVKRVEAPKDHSRLLHILPKDADLNCLDQQDRWIERGFYIKRSGKVAPLPNESDKHSSAKLVKRPTISNDKAENIPWKPIQLQLPKNF